MIKTVIVFIGIKHLNVTLINIFQYESQFVDTENITRCDQKKNITR
jgi:hypothetical protein